MQRRQMQLPRGKDRKVYPALPSSRLAQATVLRVRAFGKNYRIWIPGRPGRPRDGLPSFAEAGRGGLCFFHLGYFRNRPRPKVLPPNNGRRRIAPGLDPFHGEKFEKSGKFLADIPPNKFRKRREKIMCCAEKKSGCQCSEELKGKPEECTPTQIENCHGKKGEHLCVPKGNKKK